MNVVQQEPIGQRLRDRVEVVDNEIEVVQGVPFGRSTVRA
jgi:hypothetical protein